MKETATYVYCLLATARVQALRKAPRGLQGAGRVRLLELDSLDSLDRHDRPADKKPRARRLAVVAAVADVPLESYSARAINARLSDLDWVSRTAVAHERVVESFMTAAAVLPMKLFSIFSSDERALADFRARRRQIDSSIARVLNRDEWGVRVWVTRAAKNSGSSGKSRREGESGSRYLRRKKNQLESNAEATARAHEVATVLYDRLTARSTSARRRAVAEMPVRGGPLVLDAAFLVPRSQTRRFRQAVEASARRGRQGGYEVSVSGPWPPYSFMQE